MVTCVGATASWSRDPWDTTAWFPSSCDLYETPMTPHCTVSVWSDSESDSDTDVDADDDSDSHAQYITIYPGSPWYKPVCAGSSPRSGSGSDPLSAPSSRSSFLQISPLPPHTPAGPHGCSEHFSPMFIFDSAASFDCGCFAVDDDLLLAPQKAFERICRASLLASPGSRHPADVPVDLSDEDDWD